MVPSWNGCNLNDKIAELFEMLPTRDLTAQNLEYYGSDEQICLGGKVYPAISTCNQVTLKRRPGNEPPGPFP